MPDRIFARCPHCKQQNDDALAELTEERIIARTVFRGSRPPPDPGPRESIVTRRHCHQAFKTIVQS